MENELGMSTLKFQLILKNSKFPKLLKKALFITPLCQGSICIEYVPLLP